MTRFALLMAAAVSGLLAASATAHATALAVVEGQVFVNHGNGFQPVSGYVDLFPGDIVMAQPNAVSRITYADNCVQTIAPGSTVSVAEMSPCEMQSANQATGSVQSTASATTTNYLPYVLGVAGIGGAAALLAASGGGDGSSHSASP